MPTYNNTRSQTHAQAQAVYQRLVKWATTVRLKEDVAISIVAAAKTTLELYPLEDSGRPPPEDVEALMKSLLPSPAQIFTEDFLRSPLFSVVLLSDVASFYGCTGPDDAFTSSLELSPYETNSRNIMAHTWFAYFTGCDSETTRNIIECYKRTRGSPNILMRRGSETQGLARVLPIAEVQTQSTPNQFPRFAVENANRSQEQVITTNNNDGSPNATDAGASAPTSIPLGVRAVPPGVPPGAPSQPFPEPASRNAFPQPPPGDYEDTRKASYVHQHFKDRKFTGDITQSIQLVIRDYLVCAQQHKLSEAQRAEYFVNIFEGPARTFFLNNAQNGMAFEQLANMMIREYNSDARQLHVQGILEGLRLRKFMVEHEITNVSEGLTKLINIIEELTPQCQPEFRTNAHKISFLRKAVLGYEWAKGPISNIITSRYTFNAFVTALRESIQLENEINLVSRPSAQTLLPATEDTHYQRYGRNPRSVRKFGPTQRDGRNNFRRIPARTFEEARRRNECHKCGARWSPGHRCRPGAIRQHMRERLKDGESAVHLVSDLVLGLEGELDTSVTNGDETPPIGSADTAKSETKVCFGQSSSDLALFDSLTSEPHNRTDDIVNELDKEWFTNHLSTSIQQSERLSPSLHEKDF